MHTPHQHTGITKLCPRIPTEILKDQDNLTLKAQLKWASSALAANSAVIFHNKITLKLYNS